MTARKTLERRGFVVHIQREVTGEFGRYLVIRRQNRAFRLAHLLLLGSEPQLDGAARRKTASRVLLGRRRQVSLEDDALAGALDHGSGTGMADSSACVYG